MEMRPSDAQLGLKRYSFKTIDDIPTCRKSMGPDFIVIYLIYVSHKLLCDNFKFIFLTKALSTIK